jgi:large subunit ribosomal protein L19
VERIFPLHSPFIAKVNVKRGGETRRAKLFYLRNRVGKAVRLTEKRKAGKKEAGDAAASASEAAEKTNSARELAASAT